MTRHVPAGRFVEETEVRDMVAVRIVAALGAVVQVVVGMWAIVDARSFFDLTATYPPFNAHFLHDIGAFNLGLGATLALALLRSDALLVALGGAAAGAIAHAGSHIADAGVPGGASDAVLTTIFAVTLVAAALARWREVRR